MLYEIAFISCLKITETAGERLFAGVGHCMLSETACPSCPKITLSAGERFLACVIFFLDDLEIGRNFSKTPSDFIIFGWMVAVWYFLHLAHLDLA